jgi:hypothetical protein
VVGHNLKKTLKERGCKERYRRLRSAGGIRLLLLVTRLSFQTHNTHTQRARLLLMLSAIAVALVVACCRHSWKIVYSTRAHSQGRDLKIKSPSSYCHSFVLETTHLSLGRALGASVQKCLSSHFFQDSFGLQPSDEFENQTVMTRNDLYCNLGSQTADQTHKFWK